MQCRGSRGGAPVVVDAVEALAPAPQLPHRWGAAQGATFHLLSAAYCDHFLAVAGTDGHGGHARCVERLCAGSLRL